nr:DUF1983 domain-containing protein [Aeromonas caviae]
MAQYALAVSVISAIASAVSLVISLTAQQDPLQPSDSGVQIDKKGQNDPRLVVFGDAYVPLARVYNNANRYDNKWLVQLFSICVGPIKSVQNVYVNGVPYFGESNTNDMTGWHTQGTSGNFPNVSIGLRKGKVFEDPMYTQIVQNSSGSISSEFRGNRSASLSLQAERWITTNGDNEIRFISPNNKMAAKVQGLSVIDPRLDPNCLGKNDLSKRVWGNSYQNPACCILTYMLDGFFGLNYDVEDIDLSSFILLANYCDQQNLKFNGFLNQSKTRGEILKMFAESFGGAIYREQGLFRVRPLDKSVPVISLDESNIIGNIQIVNGNTDYFNVVKVQFTNTSSNYCEDSYVIPRNLDNDPVINDKDGKQIEKTINLPFLSDGSNFEAVKFFANRAYKKAQLVKKGIVFDVDNTIVKLKYGDVFSVSNELLKFNNKPFRVTAIKNTMDDKQLITTIDAEEYIEEVYNREDYQSGGSSGVLPPPSLQIPVPSNLVFVQNSGVAQGNGTLSWVSNYEGERRTQVQYRKTGSPTWADYGLFLMDSCSINNLATGVSYDFRIRTHAVIGISRWVEILNKPVNKNINLPAVQNLKGDFSSKDLVITWDPIKGSINNLANPVQGFTDLSQLIGYYQVTIAHDTIGNVKGTFIATSPRFTYTFDRNIQNGKSRNIFVSVTPISIYNDTGLVANGNYTNAPMGQASGVSVTAQIVTFTCRWDNRSDVVPDYMQTNIYIKPTQNEVLNPALHYVGTSVTGSFTQNIEQKSGWVVVEDVDYFGGTTPITASAPLYFVSESIDDLLTDSAFESNFKELESAVEKAEIQLISVNSKVDQNKADVDSKVALQQADIDKSKQDIITTNNTVAANKKNIDDKVAAQQVEINAEKVKLNTTVTDLNKAKNDILKNATDIKTNKTEIASQGARITTVEQVASDTTGSVVTLEQRIEAVNDDLSGKIETNKTAIATTNSSMASMDIRLSAANAKNSADIVTTQKSVTDLNSSVVALDTRLTAKTNTNASDIATNKTAISETDKSLADYKVTVSTEFGKTNGKIDTVSSSVSTLEGTVSNQGTTISSNYTDLNGKITTNSTAITNTNKSLTQTNTNLTAEIKRVDGIKATVDQNVLAIADNDSAITSLETSTNAQFGTVNGKITTLQTTTANTDKAVTALDTRLTAATTKNSADIATNKTAIAASDKALADYKVTVSTEFGKTNGKIDTVSSSVSTLEGTVSNQGTTISANYKNLNDKITSTNATVSSQGTAIAGLDSSLASFKTSTVTNFSNANARIDTVQSTATTTEEALASFKTSTNASLGNVNSRIDTTNTNLASTNTALTALDTRLTAKTNANSSSLTTQGTAITNLDSALSTYKTSNNAEVAGLKASVTTISTAQASTDGKLGAMYGLKVDAGGKVAGLTLGTTEKGSTVDFLADTFRIANASNGTPQTVFEVRDGKTMIKSLFVGDITSAQIRTGSLSGNELSANSRITVGSGLTSATMSGDDPNWRLWCGNSVSGQSPFKVSTEGRLYASNAIISGKIDALEGTFNNVTYQNGTITGRLNLHAGFIDGGSSGDMLSLGSGKFRIAADGSLFAQNGTFGGTIYADKISGDITNAGLFTFPAVSQTVTSGTLHDVFRMNLPAVSWERYMLISQIPLSWRSLENGGRFNMYLRDSTGRNTNIFGENKPLGAIDGYPSLNSFSIRIPAGCTWVALSVQGDRRQSVGYGQLPIESNWQVFKAGSGGISISAG